jgi:hypothetical protein
VVIDRADSHVFYCETLSCVGHENCDFKSTYSKSGYAASKTSKLSDRSQFCDILFLKIVFTSSSLLVAGRYTEGLRIEGW